MPRIVRPDTSKHARPRMRQPVPTPDHEMNVRRNTIAELVALGRDRDDVRIMMQQKFPDMPPHAIERMRVHAQRAFEQGTAESLSTKRAKQERRIQSLVSRCRQKGDLKAEVSAEKLLADLNGTLAPREIVISADAATRDALAAVLTILPLQTLRALAGGQHVPLGDVGPNGQQPITVEGATDG